MGTFEKISILKSAFFSVCNPALSPIILKQNGLKQSLDWRTVTFASFNSSCSVLLHKYKILVSACELTILSHAYPSFAFKAHYLLHRTTWTQTHQSFITTREIMTKGYRLGMGFTLMTPKRSLTSLVNTYPTGCSEWGFPWQPTGLELVAYTQQWMSGLEGSSRYELHPIWFEPRLLEAKVLRCPVRDKVIANTSRGHTCSSRRWGDTTSECWAPSLTLYFA